MKNSQNTSGFTLMEMIIVITIIGILMSIVTLPYNYYMDRSRVERTIDSIAQEWMLAHNNVRNGVLTVAKDHNAYLFVELEKGKDGITLWSSTGWDSPRTLYKTISFDRNIQIQDFSGISLGTATGITYEIMPPYGKWAFFTGALDQNPTFGSTGITMTIGYMGASEESGRARKILLRPYYDN